MKNRVIKFRIWCPKHEAFAYYDDLLDTIVELNGSTKNVGYWEHFDLGKDLVFQQFTGLLDKNGKEIYEGDIYKTYTEHKFYQVFFSNGAFTGGVSVDVTGPIGWDYNQNEDDNVSQDTNWLEVVGNIYENPELLNN